MQHIEGVFKGACETPIFYQAWSPEGKFKAVLLIVHGVGEDCGLYRNLVNHFIPLGYAIYGFDRSADKALKTYSGLNHEIFNEPEHEQVLEDFETWLSGRIE